MKFRIPSSLIFIAFSTLAAAEAKACLCASSLTVRDDYATAGVTVRARAERIETDPYVNVPGEMLPRRGARWVVMTVRRSYKGDTEKGETVHVRQFFFDGCEPFIAGATGVDYLLFLEEVPSREGLSSAIAGRRFRVLPCTRSAEVNKSRDNVRVVDRLSKGRQD